MQTNLLTTRATNVISQLKSQFINDRFQFDFKAAMIISGDHNKALRQEIIKQMTGETRPLTKCGLYAVSDTLTASFQQYQLF